MFSAMNILFVNFIVLALASHGFTVLFLDGLMWLGLDYNVVTICLFWE